MPYCPACRSEYRSGFSTCKDCNVALVATLPPAHELPSHDHAAEAVDQSHPTSTLFPTAPVPTSLTDNADDEESPEGFLIEGERAWIYSARTGAEAWFLKSLLQQSGLASELEFLGPGHPTPFRLMMDKEKGHDAMKALDTLLGNHPCAVCGELGPAVGSESPFCLACGAGPQP